MAGDGALLFTEEGIYEATVPKGVVINSVGAGDSLVAGFVGKYEQTKDIEKAFQYGVATGVQQHFQLIYVKRKSRRIIVASNCN